jgi:hypothetical protein
MLAAGARAFPDLAAFRCASALLLAETGRLDEARSALARLLDGALDPLAWNPNRASNLALLVEAAALAGDARHARLLRHELASLADPNVTLESIACLGSVERYRGLAAWACGDLDAALAHLEAALVAEAEAGARPFETLAARDCERVRMEQSVLTGPP